MEFMWSMWSPCGVYVEYIWSMWSPCGGVGECKIQESLKAQMKGTCTLHKNLAVILIISESLNALLEP